MKYAVIDIGSNSVRLMISNTNGEKEKFVKTTQLGIGLELNGYLSEEAMSKTIDAILTYVKYAKTLGTEKCYVFATESVRSASNGGNFVERLRKMEIFVDVLPSEKEARIGFLGAYTEKMCCVIDMGGASTEIVVGDANGLVYAKSVPIGIVRIKDKCGEDRIKMKEYISKMLSEFGQIPAFDNLLGIGGSASCFVSIVKKIEKYSLALVDCQKLCRSDVKKEVEKLYAMTMEERKNVIGLPEKRRDVIVGSGELLMAVMDMLGRDSLVVRESDNLEGYLAEQLSKEKQ